MITENLFQEILVSPVLQERANQLLIVSGYASGMMASRHTSEPVISRNGVKVRLVYGMAVTDGVRPADHQQFNNLTASGAFECHYRISLPAVHSKVYVWLANDTPIKAFAGSANYSLDGFIRSDSRQEAMSEVDPAQAYEYFTSVLQGALESVHDDVEERVRFDRRSRTSDDTPDDTDGYDELIVDDEDQMDVPLLTYSGRGDKVSGLNWALDRRNGPGNRNHNEAYIQVGAVRARSGFFPASPEHFRIHTSDGDWFTVRREHTKNRNSAADGGHAITTPEDNALLGIYFRNKLGLPLGTYITKEHLEDYGQINVTFYKLDNDDFMMSFDPIPG